jgi:hypothetical protein
LRFNDVLPIHAIILPFMDISQRSVEYLAVIVLIDHDTVHHGAPIADLRLEERIVLVLLVQAF